MNTRKFLALKLAEVAYEIGESAEHIAEAHTDAAPGSDTCTEELVTKAVILAEVLAIATNNRLIEAPAPQLVAEIRKATPTQIVNEALREALNGNMTGFIAV